MKGCFKIFAYILAGIFVLLVIAAIVSPSKPAGQRTETAAVVADGRPTVAPTATPEWMAPPFAEICGSNSELTAIQQEEKVKKMTGKKVVDWTGAIYDVQHDGDKYKVSINMDPGGIMRARQIEIMGLPADVAALKVDQKVVFSGKIDKIDIMFGTVCNPMTLTEATLKAQ